MNSSAAQPSLPPTGGDGAGGVALDRAADRATRPGGRQPASPASGCSRAAGRGPRSGGGLGATNHCRGRCHGGDLPCSEESRLVEWECPREEESAGVNYSKRSPKGNRQMRRILNQAANAAVKRKGSIFEILYVVWCRASGTIKPSGPLPTAYVS